MILPAMIAVTVLGRMFQTHQILPAMAPQNLSCSGGESLWMESENLGVADPPAGEALRPLALPRSPRLLR